MGNALCSRTLTKENLQQFDEQLKPLDNMLTNYKSEVTTLDAAIERKTSMVYEIIRDVRGAMDMASSQQKRALEDLNRDLDALDRDREYAKDKVRLLEAELTLYRHQKKDLELTITRGATLSAIHASGILGTDSDELLRHEEELNGDIEKAVEDTEVRRQLTKKKVLESHNTINAWRKSRSVDVEGATSSVRFVDEILERYRREQANKQVDALASDGLTITADRKKQYGVPASAPPRVLSEEESIAMSNI